MDSRAAGNELSGQVPTPLRREHLLRRVLAPVGSAAGVAAAVVALRVRDPHEHGSWGFCPFHAITGLDCPLCGGLRAVNDLGHADVGAALGSNVVVVLVLPLVVWVWSRWLSDCVRGPRHAGLRLPRRGLGPFLVVVLVAFAVVRNLPFAAGLAA